MRPRGSPGMLEERRRKIVAFLKRNLSLHEIGRRLGCHASSVLRWRNVFRTQGSEGLKAKPASGRPPKLSAPQKQRLVQLLAQGAVAHGYRTMTRGVNDGVRRMPGMDGSRFDDVSTLAAMAP